MGSKADMPRGFVELFDPPIKGGAHAVCHVASALRKIDAWFVSSNVGRVDCLAFRVAGIAFGRLGMFVLCYSDAVIKKQVVTLAQLSLLHSCRSIRQTYCCCDILHCWRCSVGSNMMVLLSVLCEMGLGVKAGAACAAVGTLETESMANALFVVVKTGGIIFCL